jgi:hypothetical protein
MSLIAKDGTNGRLGFPVYNNVGDTTDYLARELGIVVRAKRDQSLVNATVDPATWLSNREEEVEKIVKKVAESYNTRMDNLRQAGLPFAEAQTMCTRSANSEYLIQMEDLEITNPGSATIWGSAANTMANRNTKFNLALGEAEGDKAIYKRIRAGKKAKKAKRKAKAGAK